MKKEDIVIETYTDGKGFRLTGSKDQIRQAMIAFHRDALSWRDIGERVQLTVITLEDPVRGKELLK